MKVKVSSPFIFGLKGNVVELADEAATLRVLLTNLSKSIEGNIPLLDPKSKNLSSVFVVRLNGELNVFLPHGLDTKLEDGDNVEITLSAMAGG